MALKYPELSQSAIAKRVGCAPQNVSTVLATFLDDKTPANLEEFRANKVDILEAIQYRTLSSITQEHLSNSSALQLITGAAIIQDKLQLMAGLPTSIHITALLDVADLLRREDSE